MCVCVCDITHTHPNMQWYNVWTYYNLEGVLQLLVVSAACTLAAKLSAYRQKH